MKILFALALVLALDLAAITALTAEPAPLRGTLSPELTPVRKVYP
jgi:hypothetical protein